MSWYIKVWSEAFNFKGRARRKEFWMFNLVSFMISFGVGFVSGLFRISDILVNIYALIVLVPGIAVSVRRMHDIGRSGWWILVPFYSLYLLCLNGEPNENKYGPDPKEKENEDQPTA